MLAGVPEVQSAASVAVPGQLLCWSSARPSKTRGEMMLTLN